MNEETKEKTKSGTGIKVFAVILIIVILILVTIYALNIQRNNTSIKIVGEDEVTIEVGNEYIDAGFIAQSNGRNVNNKVKISTNLNKNKLGKYKIYYNLKILGLLVDQTAYRTVIVQDTTKPELKIDSEKEITIEEGENFEYPTYTAVDNYDGDITKKVEVDSNINTEENGTYEINYSVKDSSGNETTDKIIVNVKKKKNPYIIVSISKQTLEYYEYDKLVLFSNIVTGINNKTPVGNFKVLNKATKIILKGADYESFVNFWIAFKGHSFGFHDASWRSKFGGTIYKTNGSHGCVNMPYSKVKQLYNMVAIGTPVYIKK